jgi:protein O-GlcNAc transferase
MGGQEMDDRVREAEALRDGGKLEESRAMLVSLVAAHPTAALAHYKLGTVLGSLGHSDQAEESYREALRLTPSYPEAANNLAVLLIADGRWSEAESYLRQALAEHPDYFEGHLNAADLMQKFRRLPEALYHARRALALRPESPVACERTASILNHLGRMREAIEVLESGEASAVEFSPYWSTLGISLQGLGRHAEADRAHTRAVALAGSDFMPRTNQLFFSNYLSIPKQEIWHRHQVFGQWAREQVGSPRTEFPDISPDRNRRLRLGVVSGDFRQHSVGYFVPGMLDKLARLRFQLFAYNVSHYHDEVTASLKPMFNYWNDVAELSESDLSDRIRGDRIDILFDLSGHTSYSRLLTFARRAAPVQITYLGYPNTTGLDAMDYRLTDQIADPPGDDDEFHSETLWRLDRCFLCYSPPFPAPEVALRGSSGGAVVFGSFNSRAKYSDECLSAWAELLRKVPGSSLLLKSLVGNGDDRGREELMHWFASRGIAPGRIELLERIPGKDEHLGTYSRIDIALDTFPYNGTTTTCEALWMGVPVISLAGDRHASRVGASILNAVGLGEFVTSSVDRYIDTAAALAANLSRRLELRTGMRQRVLSSPLCDSRDMARAMGLALKEMWDRYCDSRQAAPGVRDTRSVDEAEQRIRLHIGGLQVKNGWKILNVEAHEGVDFVGDVRDLSAFGDDCCSEIYASHVLEHVAQAEVLPVLNELHRMLCPGGKLYVSVPDLETLSWLFLSPALDAAAKFHVMRMMFGGQTTPHDFHQIGYCFEFLVDYLREVGFESVEHVESLGLFNDTSEFVFSGHRISLNLVVTK